MARLCTELRKNGARQTLSNIWVELLWRRQDNLGSTFQVQSQRFWIHYCYLFFFQCDSMYLVLFTVLKAVQLLSWFCICKTFPLMYETNKSLISVCWPTEVLILWGWELTSPLHWYSQMWVERLCERDFIQLRNFVKHTIYFMHNCFKQ